MVDTREAIRRVYMGGTGSSTQPIEEYEAARERSVEIYGELVEEDSGSESEESKVKKVRSNRTSQ